jgi:hypothetical protein
MSRNSDAAKGRVGVLNFFAGSDRVRWRCYPSLKAAIFNESMSHGCESYPVVRRGARAAERAALLNPIERAGEPGLTANINVA